VNATGGGDIAEDWVDALERLFQLKWRDNALRCVLWIADAPAHGSEYNLLLQFPDLSRDPTLNIDHHRERGPLLAPFIRKMAKMNMVFIGLALDKRIPFGPSSILLPITSYAYDQMSQIYLEANGPSFEFEQFNPESGNETESIGALIEAKAANLVAQTISQTGVSFIGPEIRSCSMNSQIPTPKVTPGSDIAIDSSLNAKLSGYTIIEYVGQGSYGIVHKATRNFDSVLVAVKQTPFNKDQSQNSFRREVIALQTFHHPACLPYINSIEETNQGILITPFQPGGTLEQLVKLEISGNPISDCATKKTIILIGVAFGMEYIHKREFAHRDLKPGNVFLNNNFEPVIGDFGLTRRMPATTADDSEGPTMNIGIPLHIAPELWTDRTVSYTQAIDVYAYAMLLYSSFVSHPSTMMDDRRKPPISPQQFMMRIQNGIRFLRTETISDSYWELIQACWETEPNLRPTFSTLIDGIMRNLNSFILPGANEVEVRRYVTGMQGRR
jgi:hypothetical protein